MFTIFILQKHDSPPKELELSKAEETESAKEVITHPDGRVRKEDLHHQNINYY